MRAVGLAERAIELMCARVEGRVAFGKPLARQGVIREWIADARVAVEQLRLLVLKTAWLMDTVGNRGAHTEIQAIKIATPKVVQEIVDRAIQAHGAGGLSQDFPLAASYAAIRTLRFADGPDEVHKASLARAELARQASNRSDHGPLADRGAERLPGAGPRLPREGGGAAPPAVGPRRVGRPRDHPEDGRDRLLRAHHPRGVRRPRRRLRHLRDRHGGARPGRLRAARHRLGVQRAGRQVDPRLRHRGAEAGVAAAASRPREQLGCFGLTEPGTGSDAGNLTTQATRGRRRLRPQRPEAVHHQRHLGRRRAGLRAHLRRRARAA